MKHELLLQLKDFFFNIFDGLKDIDNEDSVFLKSFTRSWIRGYKVVTFSNTKSDTFFFIKLCVGDDDEIDTEDKGVFFN